jgi:hypothetical protein
MATAAMPRKQKQELSHRILLTVSFAVFCTKRKKSIGKKKEKSLLKGACERFP